MHNKLPLLLLSLFIFCGCEKDVDLKINENESKLVLNAWFKTGQHPTVEINRSTFIFDRRGTDRIEKAEVLLFADEQQIGRLEHFGSGFYTKKSLEIKEETEYKIIAKLDGFETVTAIEKSSVKLAKKDYSFECTTYLNTLQGYPQSETELTIKDQANSDDFYLFRIKSTSTEYDNDYPEDTTYSENYVYIQSSDLQIEEIYNNSMGNVLVLKDDLFNGNTYTVRFTSDDLRKKVYKNDTYTTIHQSFLEVHKISKSLYRYLKSLEYNQYPDPFTEPTQIFTNVENGYGILATSSIVDIPIEEKVDE